MRHRRAFTLVELLVATAVTILLVILLMSAFSGATTIWGQAEKRLDTFREARAAMDIIKRDLSAAIAARNMPALALQYDPSTSSADQVNQQVFALTKTANNGRSETSTLGYYCNWRDADKCYVLKRHFLDSNATFISFQAVAGKSPLVFSDLYKLGLDTDASEQDVAFYVWDLTFTTDLQTTYPQPTYPDASGNFPRWIEVRFKTLARSAAQRLQALPITRETWKDPTQPIYKNNILPFEQQFFARIPIAARP